MVIRTQKDRKLQTLIEVCTDFSSLMTPAHLHRPAEQTFAVHQQMETPYAEEDCDSEAVFAVVTVPHGQIEDHQIRPVSPHCNRCPHWLAGWDMRCVLLPDKRILRDNNKEIDRSLIRTGGSVLRHGPGEIIPRSSVSAAASSDGWFLKSEVVNREMAIINRETPL